MNKQPDDDDFRDPDAVEKHLLFSEQSHTTGRRAAITKRKISAAILFVICFIVTVFVLPSLSRPGHASAPLGSNGNLFAQRQTVANFDTFTSECGNWGEIYSQLHADILAGRKPPRYAISVAVEAGNADRLTGIVTEFLYALLSGRAFQILTYGKLPPFSYAFDSKYINWQAPDYPEELYEHLKFTYQGVRGFVGDRKPPPSVDPAMYSSVYWINEHINTTIETQNLTRFPSEDVPFVSHGRSFWSVSSSDLHGKVFMASNRGGSFNLFKNPYHRQQLFEMGLTPNNAFSCVYRYLFQANSDVLKLMRPITQQLSEPNALVVGVNIRVGDVVFTDDHGVNIEDYMHYFDCAREIEQTRSWPGQTVKWYLMSDSKSLRVQAAEMFPDQIVTDTSTALVHPDCEKHNPELCAKDSMVRSVQQAFAQMEIFARANFHIVTNASGFGSQAAALHPYNFGHTYYMGNTTRPCGIDDHDRIEDFSQVWAGI